MNGVLSVFNAGLNAMYMGVYRSAGERWALYLGIRDDIL